MPPEYPHNDTCPCRHCTHIRNVIDRFDAMFMHRALHSPVFVIFDRAFAEPTREQLQDALVEAVANEEYELAAELRDKLLEIQKVV